MSTEPETPADDDPPPPPPVLQPEPSPPVSFVGDTFYDVTVTCATESCVNYARVWVAGEVYSNAGQPLIGDGVCGQMVRILAATVLDPQPERI